MSSTALIFVIIFAILFLGFLVLIVPIIGFYWGPRGKPPANQAERRKAREAELAMRAEQIERSKNTPIVNRNPSFWNNRKIYK